MPSRKLRIQFSADECFPVTSVTYLKSLGYSITHVYDLKQLGKSDKTHFKVSKRLGKVLITIDRDFLYYEQADLQDHPGVVVVSSGSPTPIKVNEICKKLFAEISEEYIRHSLLKVTTNKIIRIKNDEKDEKKY
jgi:predicted nuclease of predicted toxin-antitoxin system